MLNIRDARIDDYKEISNIRKMPGVIENLLATYDEKEEKIKNRILNKGKEDCWFVPEIDGKIIGLGILNGHSNFRKKHVASLTLMVHKDYQNTGVGTKLMQRLIEEAKNREIVRVELAVFKDNYNAIRLYKKFGFKKEGIKIKSALKNGCYVDELMMSKIL